MKESRLRAMKSIKELRKSIDKTNTELKKLKAQSQELDQQINTLLGEMQKLELTRSSVRDTYEQARLDVHALQSELDSQREIVEDKVTQKVANKSFVSIFFSFPLFNSENHKQHCQQHSNNWKTQQKHIKRKSERSCFHN